jgi:hypothetical protein
MLTQEEYLDVLGRKRQGWTIDEIADDLGYHPATISKCLKAGGPPATPLGDPPSSESKNGRRPRRTPPPEPPPTTDIYSDDIVKPPSCGNPSPEPSACAPGIRQRNRSPRYADPQLMDEPTKSQLDSVAPHVPGPNPLA